jgi:hypothetical protein
MVSLNERFQLKDNRLILDIWPSGLCLRSSSDLEQSVLKTATQKHFGSKSSPQQSFWKFLIISSQVRMDLNLTSSLLNSQRRLLSRYDTTHQFGLQREGLTHPPNCSLENQHIAEFSSGRFLYPFHFSHTRGYGPRRSTRCASRNTGETRWLDYFRLVIGTA